MRGVSKTLLIILVVVIIISLIFVIDYKIYLNNKNTSYCFNYQDSELSEEKVEEHLTYVNGKKNDRTMIQSLLSKKVIIRDIRSDEINRLFMPEDKSNEIYLPNRRVEIQEGTECGIPFSIINVFEDQKISWSVELKDEDVMKKCGVSESEVNNWISEDSNGEFFLSKGDKSLYLIKLMIPKNEVSNTDTCILRFKVTMLKEDGSVHGISPFDVEVV